MHESPTGTRAVPGPSVTGTRAVEPEPPFPEPPLTGTRSVDVDVSPDVSPLNKLEPIAPSLKSNSPAAGEDDEPRFIGVELFSLALEESLA